MMSLFFCVKVSMANDMLRASKKTCNTYESYEQALKGIRDFEVDTTTKFVIWKKNIHSCSVF